MNKDLYFRIGKVFTPNAPVSDQHLFAGRAQQIKSLRRAISGVGSHAIIFGDRGVGKTSLGFYVYKEVPSTEVLAAAVSCDRGTSYSTLWRQIFERLEHASGNVFPITTYVRDVDEVSPQDVRYAFERITMTSLVLIDELDRLDKETSALMADTIKTLSDYNVPVRLIMIGVGESVSDLIEGHASIDRSLVQIQMPRMSPIELKDIVEKGLERLEMKIEEPVKQLVVRLSYGLPHYTHLLMLHAAQSAAEDDRTRIKYEDFRNSLEESAREKEQSLKNEYALAVRSTKKAFMYPYVLLACALAERDEDDYFALSDVEKTLGKIMGKAMKMASFIGHIGGFGTLERGNVLEKIGKERKFRYRFRNPLMPTFIIMKAMNGEITSQVDPGSLL